MGSQGPTGPAPGADDNASGTAALLEAARAMAESGLRPAETVVFAAFSAEELGLLGSRAFVDALREEEADVDDDGALRLTDAMALLAHLVRGGAPPPEPYPLPGLDPTPDALDCAPQP